MRIFIGAGEPSGDRILAKLLAGLRIQFPKMELNGFGGPLSEAQGLVSLAPLDRLAVNGLTDTIAGFFPLLRTYLKLRHEMVKFQPNLVLLVDFPGMNERLGKIAISHGFSLYYIAPPQLWVYRNPGSRLRRLQERLSGAAIQVLFPFEAAFYSSWAPRIYQGHFFDPPSSLFPSKKERLLLCPGSRAKVMNRNLPYWLKRIREGNPALDLDVLVPENLAAEAQRWIGSYSNIRLLHNSKSAFEQAGAAIAFPGTITLELFLRRIPTLVWAIVDGPTLWAGKRHLAKPWVALPNLLLGREVFPEWVGSAGRFNRSPPDFPPMGSCFDISEADINSVWTKMGSSLGVESAVDACMKLLTKIPVIIE